MQLDVEYADGAWSGNDVAPMVRGCDDLITTFVLFPRIRTCDGVMITAHCWQGMPCKV